MTLDGRVFYFTIVDTIRQHSAVLLKRQMCGRDKGKGDGNKGCRYERNFSSLNLKGPFSLVNTYSVREE
jgi:hypothetical protein